MDVFFILFSFFFCSLIYQAGNQICEKKKTEGVFGGEKGTNGMSRRKIILLRLSVLVRCKKNKKNKTKETNKKVDKKIPTGHSSYHCGFKKKKTPPF